MKDRFLFMFDRSSRKYDGRRLQRGVARPVPASHAGCMIHRILRLSVFLGAVLPAGAAMASSSEWFEANGGRIRLVSSGLPDASGQLRGVLDIQLDPGWKTYWRDPGDAGVPPSIDIKQSLNIRSAALDFPAPQRHNDGNFIWAGYDYSVALPVTYTVDVIGKPAIVDAAIFLGLCESICVPLQTTIALDPGSDPDNPEDAAVVAQAFASLPGPEQPGFRAAAVSKPGEKTVVVEANFPGDPASAEFFIAGGDGATFTTPVRSQRDGKTFFTTDVSLPASPGAAPSYYYTLVTDSGAVSGLLRF